MTASGLTTPAVAAAPSSAAAVPAQDDPALPARGATQQEIRIQPDCLLQISVAEDPSLNGSYPVNEIGAVDLGYIGPIILFNKTEKEAAQKITEVLLNRDFRAATTKVRIVRASYGQIKVTGAVRQPGLIKVGASDTISLNDALLRVGGLSPNAWGGRVTVYRGGMLSAAPDPKTADEFALAGADGQPSVPDISLGANDLAVIAPPSSRVEGQPVSVGEKQVLVLGEVTKPGFYRFEGADACTMMNLIFRLGDFPAFANTKAVKVVRRDEAGSESEFTVNAEKLMKEGRPEDDFVLENGDRIIVPARRFMPL